MKIILDSNEYILYLTKKSKLIDLILNLDLVIFINELIIKEVLRNINETEKKEFFKMLLNSKFIVFNRKIPKTIIKYYEKQEIKKGDLIIAALCKILNVDYLITENRHFLTSKIKDFKIFNENEFKKEILNL